MHICGSGYLCRYYDIYPYVFSSFYCLKNFYISDICRLLMSGILAQWFEILLVLRFCLLFFVCLFVCLFVFGVFLGVVFLEIFYYGRQWDFILV